MDQKATEKNASTKWMDIEKFRELGYLQEANRQFFHPLGLALAVSRNFDGTFYIAGIVDARDDPEGFIFSDLDNFEDFQRAEYVAGEVRLRQLKRADLFGSMVQPIKFVPLQKGES